MSAAREGRGGALFILGEAGLGKTTVLEEISRHAGDDLVVARARCDPMEASLAFGLLSQIVHGLDGDDVLWTAPTTQGDARATTLYRTLRWLEDAARSPVLITVDDLQWADPDSLGFLGFLCRRLAGLPIAVIASLRPWPPAAADLAWSLVNRGDGVVEHLVPLTEEAAAGVLAERQGGPFPADVAGQAWRVSGGNPLLLDLAAGSLAAERTGPTQADGVPVSVDQRSLVLARFSGLSESGTGWAQAAAVLGNRFRPDVVSEVARLDADAAEAAAEGVWRSGLAREGANGAAEFVHPLFAQLLYEDIAPLARAHLHARAFTALVARGMEDIAAEHAVRANLAGDARAIGVLTETGRRAFRAGAPATAANRLQAAVRLSGDGATAALLGELGQALYEAGRLDEAVVTITHLLETGLPLTAQVEALTMLSRAHYSMGQFDAAGAALQAATAMAEQECPGAVVRPLCDQAGIVLMTAGPAAALPIADRAREFAHGGDKGPQAHARATWGMLSFWSGDPSGLVAAQSEGRHLLGKTPAEIAADLRLGSSGVLLPFAITAVLAGNFNDAEAALRGGTDEAERIGDVNAAASLQIAYGLMLLLTRVGDSLAVADGLLAIADLVPLAEPFARTMRSYALLQLGDERQSAAEGERAQATAAPYGGWHIPLWLGHIQGLRMLRHGRFKEASEVYAELEERHWKLGIGEPCTVPYARHAVLAHVRAGRIGDAERVVDWLEERASHLPCRWIAAAAAGGRAVLALRDDRPQEADKCYRAALEHLDGASLPLEQAEVMIDHGTMLRHDGRPREARESFRQAGELAESVGAIWLAHRAGEELAAAGGRRRARRGAHVLTPQEQRIAGLAATGASNRDIATNLTVSVRTVRTHLEHIYAKLGVHSRRELMTFGERLEEPIGRRE